MKSILRKYSKILVSVLLLTGINITELKAQAQLTNLPTLYITTAGGADVVSKEDYLPGALKVVGSAGTPGLYDGPIEIRGRGNSTWGLPKKPYRIKLTTKYNLLGLPANENKWVLLANYQDNTLIRNCLAFELGRFVGFAFTPAFQLVDVYLNGSYKGNYLLTDQVERGNNRVSVDKLDAVDTTEPKISGGYLLQAEMYADQEPINFRTGQGMAMAIKYPDDKDINSQQINYIKNYFNSYESKLFSAQALDPVLGYRPMNDRTSQVNWYIATELTGNPDSYLSIYMTKLRNDPKIYFGPMWDYDAAFGNYSNYLGNTTYKRMSSEAYGRGFAQQMLLDPEFRAAIKVRWNELKAAGIAAHLDNKIVALASQVSASQVQNKTVWGYSNPENLPNFGSKPYQDFITELRAYVKNRIAYLDQQFNDQIRTDMYYKLLNRTVPKVIDLNNTGLLAVSQSESASPLSQQWLFLPVDVAGVRYYRIQNRLSSQYLTAPSLLNEQLKLTSDPQVDAQLWKPVGTDNNVYYGFTNKYSNRSIQNPNGDNVTQSSQIVADQPQIQWTLVPFEPVSGPLPVTIFGLEAKSQESSVRLSWNVSENIDGEKFIIQRTSDPSTTQPDSIGVVRLHDANDASYQFDDVSPSPGINYYRLKIVDLDGSFAYSRYVKVDYSILQDITIFPQPAAGSVNIAFKSQFENPVGEIQVINLLGQKISTIPMTVRKGYNEFKLTTKNYPPGMYEVRFFVNSQISTKKMLILAE